MANRKVPSIDGGHKRMPKERRSDSSLMVTERLLCNRKKHQRIGAVPVLYHCTKGEEVKCQCSNCVDICLLCVVGKLYGINLTVKVMNHKVVVLGDERCGFRNGKTCVDQIFVVRAVCEIFFFWQRKERVFPSCMHLEKAYDRVDKNAMWPVLR